MQIVYYLLEGIHSSFIFVHVTPAEALANVTLLPFLEWGSVHPPWREGAYFWRKGQFFPAHYKATGLGTCHTLYYVQPSLILLSSIPWDLELWNWFKKRTLHCNSSSKTFVPKLQILCPLPASKSVAGSLVSLNVGYNLSSPHYSLCVGGGERRMRTYVSEYSGPVCTCRNQRRELKVLLYHSYH